SKLASLQTFALILAVFGHMTGCIEASYKKERNTGLMMLTVREPLLR
ncbi:19127_t:CDS:1, partial [Racocetra persica]